DANGDVGIVGGQTGTNSAGGFVQFSDLASGINGRLAVDRIAVNANGASAPAERGALIESAGGPTNVGTFLSVGAAGPITVVVTGNGTINAGFAVEMTSSAGDIVITHASQPATPVPTISADQITVDAANTLTASQDTLLSATSFLTLRAR